MGILSEASLMARTYFGSGYPSFIYSWSIAANELPAFCYHDMSAAEFESHVLYLKQSGYTTVSCDSAVAALRSPSPDNARMVLLTFDDGLTSLYQDIFPVAVRQRVTVVAYIVPAWVGQPGFVTWQQCREMSDSGWIDLQSHSYAHARIVTEATLDGWWQPRGPEARPWGVAGFEPLWLSRSFRGLPMMRGRSLFSGGSAIEFPPQFWDQCSQMPPNATADGRARALAKLVDENAASVLTEEEVSRRIQEDVEKSKAAIGSEVQGHEVRHFAFPWHENSPIAWEAIERAGFASAATGLEMTNASRGAAASVTRIPRVNGDFLFCLPGKGRKSFVRVSAEKALRRLMRGEPYGVAD